MDEFYRQMYQRMREVEERNRKPKEAIPTTPSNQNEGFFGDIGTALKRGVQRVPGALTGLLDIPVAGITGTPYASQAADIAGAYTGFTPGKWAQEAEAEYSPAQQAAEQQARSAEGVWDTAKAYLTNPRLIATGVTESLPGMVAGGGLGMGARAAMGLRSGLAAAGIGEGAIMGGQSMQGMIEQGADPRTAAALATGVGVAGGAIGALGGTLAQKMRVLDPDVLLVGAGRPLADKGAGSLVSRMAKGAVSEGLIEEAPQSAIETIASNLALGQPWAAGVPEAMTAGAIIGGAMGAGTNIMGLRRPVVEPVPAEEAPPAATAEPVVGPTAPTPAVTTEPTALTPAVTTEPTASEPTEQPVAAPLTTFKRPTAINTSVWNQIQEALAKVTTDEELEAILKTKGLSNNSISNLRNQWNANKHHPAAKYIDQATEAESAEPVARDLFEKTRAHTPPALSVPVVSAKKRKKTLSKEEAQKVQSPEFLTGVQKAIDNDEDFDIDVLRKAAAQEDDTADLDVDIPEARQKDFTKFEENIDTVLAASPTISKYGIATKPDLDAKDIAAIISLYQGYTPALGNKRAATKKGLVSTTDRVITRAVNRLGGEDAPIVKAFEHIHKLLTDVDNARRLVASNAAIDITSRGTVHKQKAPSIDLDLEKQAAYADTPRNLAQQVAKEVVGSHTAIEGNEDTFDLDTDIDVIPGLRGTLEELQSSFRALENAIGRNNLRTIQYISKNLAHNTTRKGTGENIKVQGEEMPAVRFSQLYKNYKDGTLLDMGVQYDTMREEWQQTEKSDTVAKNAGTERTTNYVPGVPHKRTGLARTKIEQIIEERLSKTRRGPKADTPAEALLQYVRDIPMMPAGNLIANRLLAILKPSDAKVKLARGIPEGTAVQDFLNELTVTISHNKQGERGARAQYHPAQHRLVIYQAGANPATILHEFLHVATIGFVKNNPNHPAVKALDTLRTHTARILQEDPTHLRSDIKSILNILNGEHGIYEFITYGLTYKPFQEVLKKRPAVDEKGNPLVRGLKNLWQVFAFRLKTMLGMGAVKNSTFEQFLDATSAVLGDVYKASNEGTDVFKWFGEQDKFSEQAYNPEEFVDTPEAKRAEESAAKRASTAKKTWEKKAKEKEEAKQAEAKKAQEAAKAQLTAADKLDKADISVITAKKNKTDANIIDKAERRIADMLIAVLSGGKYSDWEKFIDAKWSEKAGSLEKYVSENNTTLSNIVGSVLKNFVDQYGTKDAFKNMTFNVASAAHGRMQRDFGNFETLQNASDDIQQAVLDYLDTKDNAALHKTLNDQAKEDAVKNIVESLEKTRTQALALGKISEEDATRPLRELVRMRESAAFPYLRGRKFGDVTAPKSSTAHMEHTVGASYVLNPKGEYVTQISKGAKYYHMRDAAGEDYFIQVGSPKSVVDKFGLSPVPGDLRPYSIKGEEAQGELTMQRLKSFAEIKADNKKASAIASLIYMNQDWARRVETTRYVDDMIRYNESLENEDEKWILNEAPTHKNARILDMNDPDVRNKPSNLSKARMPGVWVKVEDNPTKWGLLSGKYVAGPAYAALEDIENTKPIVDSEAWRAAMMTWKKMKTVYSPVTHVNNIMGNVVLSYYHDIPASNVKRALRTIVGYKYPKLGKKIGLTKEEIALAQEFEQSGATLGQIKDIEFDPEAASAIRGWTATADSTIRGITKGAIELEKILDWIAQKDQDLADIYSEQDNIFRLAAYITKLENLQYLRKQPADKLMRDEAARYASKSFVDYNIHAPAIKALRQTVLPFIAWPYRMIPLIAKTFVTKPWKAANTVAAIYALNALAYAATGGDEDEERKALPEYMQNNVWGIPGAPTYARLPWGTGDKASYLGIGRMLPLGDVAAIGDSGLPGIVTPSGPAIVALQALFNYDNFTGKNIVEDTDSSADAAKKQMHYLAKGLGPGVYTTTTNWFDKVLLGKQGPLGSEANAWIETARLFGANIRQIDLPEAQYNKLRENKALMDEYAKARRAAIKAELRYGDPDVEDLYADITALNDRMYEQLDELKGE